jgi:LCP family protein required for cell wall assembly
MNRNLSSLLKKPLLIKAGFLLGLVIVALLFGMLAYLAVRNLVFSDARAAQSGPDIVEGQGTPLVNEQGTPLPPLTNPNAPASAPTLTPWDGKSRVTILLLGLDYRDWSAGEKYSRSDTMILLTLDPLNKTAGMLSIPRDMWVAIPGFQHGKINTAYYLGDAYKLPGGGPGLAVKTVEQFLGVPIKYYAQIDFDAFVKFIDEIGGVKINVPEKITVDLLGSGSATKKTLKPGVQVLPGQWALAYARNRYTQGGDFDRAQRQQQVILGIRDRILSFDMLPTLIKKAPMLFQQLSGGVHTNLGLDDAIKLALLAKDVPAENIKQGVLGTGYTIFGRSPDNLSIVIPIPDKVHLLRDEIFATSGSLGPLTTGDSQQQMQSEGASLAIYNGSSESGLATASADYLKTKGANITLVGDADQSYAATTIVDHRGDPYTLKYLVDLFKISPNKIFLDYDASSSAAVELYLGNDAQGINLP